MGTRSYTHVFEGDTLLVSIYRQYDGYPSGHGRDVKDALGSRQLVNGIRGSRDEVVNGMSCAAAVLVAYLKKDLEAGGVYIEKPDANRTEEYTYYISGKSYNGRFLGSDEEKKTINLRVVSGWYGEIYNGPIEDFDPDMKYGDYEEDED